MKNLRFKLGITILFISVFVVIALFQLPQPPKHGIVFSQAEIVKDNSSIDTSKASEPGHSANDDSFYKEFGNLTLTQILATLNSEKDAKKRLTLRNKIADSVILTDPSRIAEVRSLFDNDFERNSFFAGLPVIAIRNGNWEAIKQAIIASSSRSEIASFLGNLSIQLIHNRNFNGALKAFNEMPFCDDRDNVLVSLASRYPKIDIDSALNWLSKLENRERDLAVERFLQSIEEDKEQIKLVKLIPFLTEASDRERAISNALAFAQQDSDTATPINLISILNDNEKIKVEKQILIRSMVMEPGATIDSISHATENWPDDIARGSALRAIISIEMGRNLMATADTVSKSSGLVLKIGIPAVVDRMYRIDSDGTAEWINRLQSGVVKDAAIRQFVLASMDNDPDGARIAIKAVSDARLRAELASWIK